MGPSQRIYIYSSQLEEESWLTRTTAAYLGRGLLSQWPASQLSSSWRGPCCIYFTRRLTRKWWGDSIWSTWGFGGAYLRFPGLLPVRPAGDRSYHAPSPCAHPRVPPRVGPRWYEAAGTLPLTCYGIHLNGLMKETPSIQPSIIRDLWSTGADPSLQIVSSARSHSVWPHQRPSHWWDVNRKTSNYWQSAAQNRRWSPLRYLQQNTLISPRINKLSLSFCGATNESWMRCIFNIPTVSKTRLHFICLFRPEGH